MNYHKAVVCKFTVIIIICVLKSLFKGVTTQFPTKVVLPPIPQDLCREIYMLEGNNLYNNNARNRRPYTFDIDTIPVGTLLGNDSINFIYP